MPTTISLATREIQSHAISRKHDFSGALVVLALTVWAFAMLFIACASSGMNTYVESLQVM
jgi:hypothetical protein